MALSEREMASRRNGGRWLLTAAMAAAASFMFLVAVVVWAVFIVEQPPDNLRYVSPQVVITDGPYREGDTFSAVFALCNDTNRPIHMVISRSSWRRLAPSFVSIEQSVMADFVFEPGCVERVGELVIPDLQPGTWRLEGFEESRDGERETWFTEPFKVVE
jgi:hypothetical protein